MQVRWRFARLLLFGMLLAASQGAAATVTYVQIDFYSQRIQVNYESAMFLREPARIDEQVLQQSYRELERNNAALLLRGLSSARERLALNDFLFFRLIDKTLTQLYGARSPRARTITAAYLLAKAGFDIRLTYRQDQVFINAYCREQVFEIPMIREAERSYVNLSCYDGNCTTRQSLYLAEWRPNPGGRAFSFSLQQWPLLPARMRTRELAFTYRKQRINLPVTYDQTIVDIMRDYPLINEYCYLDMPLSPSLQASLLPQLRRLIDGLGRQQALEVLASFTRSGFSYKEDNEQFGKSKPMVPEELFGYAFSDCEDRSALFYALVRELLDLPMAVVAYDDHLTVAVAASDLTGDSFSYRGRRYIFCDPTGPANSSVVGVVPPGYEKRSFEIIGTYK